MVKLKMLALGVSAVLGVATTVLIVMFSTSAMHWFSTLSATQQRGCIYAFIFLSVLLSVLNGWRLWRRAKEKRAA
jgi:hypothetical protein